jgi:hypothetical protein
MGIFFKRKMDEFKVLKAEIKLLRAEVLEYSAGDLRETQ